MKEDFDKLVILAAEEVARQWDAGNVNSGPWLSALTILTAAVFLRDNYRSKYPEED